MLGGGGPRMPGGGGPLGPPGSGGPRGGPCMPGGGICDTSRIKQWKKITL